MKILVTGANGFIGHALCRHLLMLRHLVVPTVRRHSDLPDAITVSEASSDVWTEVLECCDSVVHLAGRAHVLRESASDALAEFRRVNTEATLRLARQSAVAGVKRFVYISTIGVNGNLTSGAPFTELTEPQPHDAYSVSKYEAELGLMAIQKESGMEVVIIRPPLVYGPGAKGNLVILLKWVLKGIPLPLGCVTNKRSFIALDNLLDFIGLCADRELSPKAANQIFLIADGEDVSTTEFLRRVAAAYGRASRLFPFPTALLQICALLAGKKIIANRLLHSLVIDASKARELLDWRPPVKMDEQLRRMSHATFV